MFSVFHKSTRSKALSRRGTASVAAALLATVILTGCVYDKPYEKPSVIAESNTVTFALRVPGHSMPTRATAADEVVTSASVILFDAEGMYVDYFAGNVGEMTDNTIKFTTPLKKGEYNIVVVANTDLSAVENDFQGLSKAELLALLTCRLNTNQKWDISSMEIPMAGEIEGLTEISDGSVEIPVSLYRMLARIDVINSDNPSGSPKFQMSQVILSNSNTVGNVAPQVDASTGKLLFGQTNIPASPGKTDAKLTYNCSNSLTGSIYTFESAVADDSAGDADGDYGDATRIIVYGKYISPGDYMTSYGYYPIDFTYDGSDDTVQGDYMPLIRNHKYVVEITEVNGPGYMYLYEAEAAYTKQSNMKIRIISYDESAVSDFVYNGQYYLGLQNSEMVIPWDADGIFTNLAATNYLEHHSISVVGHPNWMSVSAEPGTSNTMNSYTNIKMTANQYNFSQHERSGEVMIRVGDLVHSFSIIQKGVVAPNCYVAGPGETISIPYMVCPNMFDAQYSRSPYPGDGGEPATCVDGITPDDAQRVEFEFFWSDKPGVIQNTSFSYEVDGYHSMLNITTGDEGNALVGIKLDGVVKWSWHIWVSAEKETIMKGASSSGYEWMDRNIGALINHYDSDREQDVAGLRYVYGRKDPFPGSRSLAMIGEEDTMIDLYDYLGGTFTMPDALTIEVTLSEAVKNPTQYYWDWISWSSDGHLGWLWNDATLMTGIYPQVKRKSLFDPCPAGWKLPETYEFILDNWTYSDSICGAENAAMGGYYPFTKSLYYYDNAYRYTGGAYTQYKAADPAANRAQNLYLSFSEAARLDMSYLTFGTSIRCIKYEQ